MSRQILFLGAPLPSALKWDEGVLLDEHEVEQHIFHSTAFSERQAEWRQLRSPSRELEPSFFQPTGIFDAADYGIPVETAFFRTTDIGSMVLSQPCASDQSSSLPATVESSDDVLSEFYDHSFAVHADVASSQIDRMDSEPRDHALPSPTSHRAVTVASGLGHLSDLEDVPNAVYLRTIVPQTMTVNLIVAVMSLPSPRSVVTGRQWGREQISELVEILVGDETKAGFGITLWLSDTPEGVVMRKQIERLRLRDIVLLRNVALSSFRDKVHGQSLRRGITKVDLLYGRGIDIEDGRQRGAYAARDVNNNLQTVARDPQLMKVRKVRDWMETFVGDTSHRSRDTSRTEAARTRRLPPDTQ